MAASHGPPARAAATPAEASTRPDTMRGPRSDQSPRVRAASTASGGLRRRPSKAAITAAEDIDRLAQRVLAEIGPEHIEKYEFRVGRLPEHEIGQPEFARGADQQIGCGKIFGVEIRLENLAVEVACLEFPGGDIFRKAARSAHNLSLATIVEGNGKIELVVVLGSSFGVLDDLGNIALQAFAAANHTHTHAFANEFVEIAVHIETEQIEKRVHFL